MYSANSPELERYHILSTEGYDIPDVLEQYVANIEREICMCERMLVKGDVSDMDDEDFHADEVLKALTGLNLFVEVKCEDESDDDDAMYVNAANLMFMLQHGQKDKAGMDYYFHPMRVSMKCNLIESKTGKHPTQKPLSVLSRIVLASTKKGDIVLDPFAGSSTTGIASVLFGRRYIGIDTEAEYLDISKKRYEEVSHADKIAYRGQIEGIDNTIIEAYDQ